MNNTDKLIFVYHANSDLFSTVTDFAHKIISPSTYNCQLCALTHGHFGAKGEWKDFLKTLDLKKEFLHKDEFAKNYPDYIIELPAILIEREQQTDVLISAEELAACTTLKELKSKITSKLSSE